MDTLGLPIDLLITPAHVSDKEGLKLIYGRIDRPPKVIFADEGYTSHELAELYEKQGTRIEVVKKDKSKGAKDEKQGFCDWAKTLDSRENVCKDWEISSI